METLNKLIILEREAEVATITLNRPETMNAIDKQMIEELVAATEEVQDDPEVKVVILTGRGKGFCAGGDLDSPIYDLTDPGELSAVVLMFGKVSLNLRNMPKPVIAMVNGVAAGAGFSFVLACDIIIASHRARFAHAYLNIGVQSDAGATYFLPRIVGVSRACELIFSGEIIDAREAERIGLVNRVVPAAELGDRTMELALKLTQKPSLAIGMAKKSIHQGLTMDLATAIEFEARAHTMTMLSDDMKEGVAAFKEKRSPQFRK
jgi:2-(1,2-epoxy-1,2-dihydrophenyl)acetyl-CoA isomerase